MVPEDRRKHVEADVLAVHSPSGGFAERRAWRTPRFTALVRN